MALIKCHECGNDVSTEAAACPKCGAPVKVPANDAASAKKPNTKKPHTKSDLIVGIIITGLIIWWFASPSSDKKDKPTDDAPAATDSKPASDKCKADDLQCLGDKGGIAAGIYCKEPVEHLAKHDVKWTDGTFDMKFDHFRWKDKSAGIITYIGDKAEFQNGFGAYTPVVYECDLSPDNKTVLDVRVQEGRLPN